MFALFEVAPPRRPRDARKNTVVRITLRDPKGDFDQVQSWKQFVTTIVKS